METNKIALGTGIFIPKDISLILGINSNKINSWLNNYWTDKIHLFDKTKTINFLNLIEIYVFNTFLENGISRKKILQLHKHLCQKLNVDFSFCL